MRRTAILREAWAITAHQPVSSVLIALLGAAMCLTTLLTVGRTVASEQQVIARLEDAGSRLISVEAVGGDNALTPAVVTVVAAVDAVERTVGAIAPVDVRATATAGNGNAVPAWGIVGDLPAAATLIAGRWPEPGEAVATADAAKSLGLDGPVGAVTGGLLEVPIVGIYQPRAPFESLSGVLYLPRDPTPATSLRVLATSAAQAAAVERAVIAAIGAPPDTLSIESPATLADIQSQIGADLKDFGRGLLLLVLGAGSALTSIVVFADVLIRRADLGRRRALGATRSTVIGLVVLRTLYAATAGAATATILGFMITRSTLQSEVPLSFMIATATLAVLTASVTTLPPALMAAHQDPLRVLRTP